jgi:hypothetical protein
LYRCQPINHVLFSDVRIIVVALNGTFATTSQHTTHCGLSSPLATTHVNLYLWIPVDTSFFLVSFNGPAITSLQLHCVLDNISNRSVFVTVISCLINITTIATYQNKNTFHIVILKMHKEMAT